MAAKPLPSQGVLHQLLRYDADTGKLYWKERPASMFKSGRYGPESEAKRWNAKNAGAEAFTALTDAGHAHGTIFDVKHRAHRVVWKLIYGEEPISIDHINGNPKDNRLENLRAVTHKENMRNQKMRSTNSSGHQGVRWVTRLSKFRAQICVDGRPRHLGVFDNLDAALAARKEAERKHGFHANHGRSV